MLPLLLLAGAALLFFHGASAPTTLIPGHTYHVTIAMVPNSPAGDRIAWTAKGWTSMVFAPGATPARATFVSLWGGPQTVVRSDTDANVFPAGATLLNLVG